MKLFDLVSPRAIWDHLEGRIWLSSRECDTRGYSVASKTLFYLLSVYEIHIPEGGGESFL